MVKYFIKNHRYSKDKFRLLTKDFDARKVIDTIVAISADIIDKKPNASFGFVGEPLLTEKDKEKTKRFRVYFKYATKHFSPDNWGHYPYYDISAYLLLNSTSQLSSSEAEEFFKDYLEI
ncbi:MAG: hypothetical protein HWE07_01265 [Cytophagia bacterium]|nr:hypothetical protein [Cytophagia bacterium]